MDDDGDRDPWPVDDLFADGIDLSPNPADLLYEEQQQAWEEVPLEPADVDPETLAAMVDAATQFHYIYLSQLLIMGDLLWNAPDMGTKRLATVISASRMRDVDAWGQYLAHLKLVRPKVSAPLKSYFRQLYEEDSSFARLMGLIFVDVFRKALADELQDVEDPTFRKLMQRDAAEGKKNVRLTKQHLQQVSAGLDDAMQETAADQMDAYMDRIAEIVDDRAASFDALGADPDTIMAHCRDTIDEYRAIIRDG